MPTALIGGLTALGFVVQERLIEKYKADSIRQVQDVLDREEAEEAAALRQLREPTTLPPELLQRSNEQRK